VESREPAKPKRSKAKNDTRRRGPSTFRLFRLFRPFRLFRRLRLRETLVRARRDNLRQRRLRRVLGVSQRRKHQHAVGGSREVRGGAAERDSPGFDEVRVWKRAEHREQRGSLLLLSQRARDVSSAPRGRGDRVFPRDGPAARVERASFPSSPSATAAASSALYASTAARHRARVAASLALFALSASTRTSSEATDTASLAAASRASFDARPRSGRRRCANANSSDQNPSARANVDVVTRPARAAIHCSVCCRMNGSAASSTTGAPEAPDHTRSTGGSATYRGCARRDAQGTARQRGFGTRCSRTPPVFLPRPGASRVGM
jgi:hypothetical protein